MKTDTDERCPHGWPARECLDCTPSPVARPTGCPIRGILIAVPLGGIAWGGVVLGWRFATRLGGWA